DARKEPALAPFVLAGIGAEAPAQGKTLGFERRERPGDLAGVEAEGGGERRPRRRPLPFEPAAQDLDQRRAALPIALVTLWGRDRRVEAGRPGPGPGQEEPPRGGPQPPGQPPRPPFGGAVRPALPPTPRLPARP